MDRLRRPVDGASIAVFRVGFGLLGVAVVARLLAYGWWKQLYLDPLYLLPYPGFEWLPRPSAAGLLLHLAAIAISAAAVALGWRTRAALAVFFVSFTWLELLDQTTYLNHYVWISAAALLMAMLPLRGGAASVPAWTLFALRAQVGLVYVFAGIAKLNPDWLLHAQPLRTWLGAHADLPMLGPLLSSPWAAWPASWAAALFDLTIAGWLSWRPTRPPAFAAVVLFHVLTRLLFPIGLFPWIMILGATLFFPPEWPRQVAAALGAGTSLRLGAGTSDSLGAGSSDRPSSPARDLVTRPSRHRSLAPALVAAVLVMEALLPLRRFALPGDAHWNEEGYRLSWLVMANEKAGFFRYRVSDPRRGESFEVLPSQLFSPLQVERMAHQPRLIAEGARLVADHFAELGRPGVEVRAAVLVSHNGRRAAPLLDPEVDLARRPLPAKASWILPAPWADERRRMTRVAAAAR